MLCKKNSQRLFHQSFLSYFYVSQHLTAKLQQKIDIHNFFKQKSAKNYEKKIFILSALYLLEVNENELSLVESIVAVRNGKRIRCHLSSFEDLSYIAFYTLCIRYNIRNCVFW